MQQASVLMPDGLIKILSVPAKANGKVLFDDVAELLKLVRKEYFALYFFGENGTRHWVRDDRRIAQQLKGLALDFVFDVRFYPPDPATLGDDVARHCLFLIIRREVHKGRLPATLAMHALLGSYVVQAERGDYEDAPDYTYFLSECHLAPAPSPTLYEKIRELHERHNTKMKCFRGQTAAEAESHYLDCAKKLSLYGVFLFSAKDSKGTPIQVGVSAHGIALYLDSVRIHRFIWQNIIQVAYKRNTFTIKVHPAQEGESPVLFILKVTDYASAKRIWNCAVEHHKFFRLSQSDAQQRKGLLQWASEIFLPRSLANPVAADKKSGSPRCSSPASANDSALSQRYEDGTGSHDLTTAPEKTPSKSYTLHTVEYGMPDKEVSNLPKEHLLCRSEELPTIPIQAAGPVDECMQPQQVVNECADNISSAIVACKENISILAGSNEAEEFVSLDEHSAISYRLTEPRMEEASTETDDMVRVLESAEELSGKQVVMTSTREKNVITNLTAVCETGTDAVAHKSIGPEEFVVRGNIIFTRCVTLADRTVKIIKYEVETNGLVEIRTEYFVAIHSGANIDHDAELNEAILLATNMNPNMTVEETQLKLES